MVGEVLGAMRIHVRNSYQVWVWCLARVKVVMVRQGRHSGGNDA